MYKCIYNMYSPNVIEGFNYLSIISFNSFVNCVFIINKLRIFTEIEKTPVSVNYFVTKVQETHPKNEEFISN